MTSTMPITDVVFGRDHPSKRPSVKRKPARIHGTPLASLYGDELRALKKRMTRRKGK